MHIAASNPAAVVAIGDQAGIDSDAHVSVIARYSVRRFGPSRNLMDDAATDAGVNVSTLDEGGTLFWRRGRFLASGTWADVRRYLDNLDRLT